MKRRTWPDRFGMVVAMVCATHCATLTAVFLLYPALWLNRRYWEIGLWQKLLWLEWTLLAATWLLVLTAMTLGWYRHRHAGPGLLALVAVGLMSAVILTPLHFSSPWVPVVSVIGGLAVLGAHAWNLRLARRAS